MLSEHPLQAHLVLLLIGPFAILTFYLKRPRSAALWVIFAVTLFAPEVAYFKFPATPALTKQNIPYLAVLAMLLVRSPRTIFDAKPFRGVDAIALIPLGASVITAMTNTDPQIYGTYERTFLPGLDLKDGLALGIGGFFEMWPPFFIGYALFRTQRDLRELLTFLVGAGLIYAPFLLIEVRLSPQLHAWIYGYYAHEDFSQTMRWGGFRPMVFMRHGLVVALFAFVCTGAAFLLAREGRSVGRLRAAHVAVFLAVVLVLCKSTGVIGYLLLFGLPLLRWRPRAMARLAVIGGSLVLLYPVLRSADLFPTMQLTEFFEKLSADRAQSMLFRFVNEDLLLDKARERVVFGWGSYGRNQIFADDDGRMISVTDGEWIILLGERGVVGMVSAFALLIYPPIVLWRRLDRIPIRSRQMLAGFSLIVMITVIDLVPNALLSIYPFFLSGALMGLVEGLDREQARVKKRASRRRKRAAMTEAEAGQAPQAQRAGSLRPHQPEGSP